MIKERYFIAKKEVSKEVVGEFEFIKQHVIKLDNKQVIDFILDFCDLYDDPEEAYFKGIFYSWDDLHSLDVDKFIEAVEEKIKDFSEDSYGPTLSQLKKIFEFVKPCKGYQLIYKEVHE